MNIAQRHIETIRAIASVEHRPEDDVLNEALDRCLAPPSKANGEHASLEDDAAVAASQREAIRRVQEAIRNLPPEELDEFSAEDHDQVIYRRDW